MSEHTSTPRLNTVRLKPIHFPISCFLATSSGPASCHQTQVGLSSFGSHIPPSLYHSTTNHTAPATTPLAQSTEQNILPP